MSEVDDAQMKRIIELEEELRDARLEIEGIRNRKKCVTAPSRERCEQIAARISKTDKEASDLIELLPFYVDNAATWCGIAAAMEYEPLAHKEARPLGKWLNERVTSYREKAAIATRGSDLQVTNPVTIAQFVGTLANHGVKLPLLEADDDVGTLTDADGTPVLVVDVDRERTDKDVAWIVGMIQVAVNTCGGFKAERQEGSAG